jgi:hypothetical protein
MVRMKKKSESVVSLLWVYFQISYCKTKFLLYNASNSPENSTEDVLQKCLLSETCLCSRTLFTCDAHSSETT